MDNNIKISVREVEVPNIFNQEVDISTQSQDLLETKDNNLISSYQVDSSFNTDTDTIDIIVITPEGVVTNIINDHRDYGVERIGNTEESDINTLILYPEQDAFRYGYELGDIIFQYRFIRHLFYDSKDTTRDTTSQFFIEEISPDRTEIKASSLQLSDENIVVNGTELKDRFAISPFTENIKAVFYKSTYLQIINAGVLIDETDRTFLLLKLYQPLPDNYSAKDVFEVIEEVSDRKNFFVQVQFPSIQEEQPRLKGPNFNIDLLDDFSNPTEFKNKEEILLLFTGSNYETYSVLGEFSSDISIDHISFENFVHFSSAEERLKNFKYKLSKIQEYQKTLSTSSILDVSVISSSITYYESLVNSIVQNFDHYDRFLYYESSSHSWPKLSNSAYPYVNQSVDSIESQTWYNDKILSASFYDAYNVHRLINTIPTYLRDDEANAPYNLFLDMIGQFFDNQWLYAKAVTDRYDNDNRLNYGISRDLVADALRGFGVKLYGSDVNFENLFSMFTGEFYITGSEQINTFISSSNIPTSVKNYQQEVYKRLYHNIPLLLKSKGTERGLRALINSYGIPKNLLEIRYYGGDNTDTFPFFGDTFSVTSSLDRIRLDNTGSIVQGNTLSYDVSVVNKFYKYSQDLHTLEVGFSPTNNLNNFLISSSLITSSFDIDSYIGDPRTAYDKRYTSLNRYNKSLFSGSVNTGYNLLDFVRLLKFYDNTLFKIIKDFVPARTNVSTGIIIKPYLLERSKIKQVQPKWSKQTRNTGSNIDYLGTEYETNFAYDGVIDIIGIHGSDGGSFGSGSLSGSYGNFTFFSEYDTRFSYTVLLPTLTLGTKTTHDEAKYNGEFGQVIGKKDGSITYSPQALTVTDGELNDENEFKKTSLQPYYYLLRALQRVDD